MARRWQWNGSITYFQAFPNFKKITLSVTLKSHRPSEGIVAGEGGDKIGEAFRPPPKQCAGLGITFTQFELEKLGVSLIRTNRLAMNMTH